MTSATWAAPVSLTAWWYHRCSPPATPAASASCSACPVLSCASLADPPDHVHPRNKTEVGRRLAAAVLHTQYAYQWPQGGANVTGVVNWRGPAPVSATVASTRIAPSLRRKAGQLHAAVTTTFALQFNTLDGQGIFLKVRGHRTRAPFSSPARLCRGYTILPVDALVAGHGRLLGVLRQRARHRAGRRCQWHDVGECDHRLVAH